MDESLHLTKVVTLKFKLSGFKLNSDLATYLVQHLLSISPEDREEHLQFITEHIQNQNLLVPHIERSHLKLAIEDRVSFCRKDDETIFSVIDAFNVPSYTFSNEQKKHVLNANSRCFLPPAIEKAAYMRERYTMLWQRTIRHELFSTMPGTSTSRKFKLRTVEQLLAKSIISDVIVLGLLTQLTEGQYYIEDLTGSVLLDLTQAKFHTGLFFEGCFVLVEGTYTDQTLRVCGFGFPPPELANSSRTYFGSQNTWGGRSSILHKNSQSLKEIERMNNDATIVFLSDCWLDQPDVIDKLRILFSGYDECPPVAIVLMGPFVKSNVELPTSPLLRNGLSFLADALQPCKQLIMHTDLVLVPDVSDAGAVKVLPRPPLPGSVSGAFQKRVPRAIFASNPCRLQYCTQQIVVCRLDLITKCFRNSINFPTEGNLEDHFARTLICQGTLAPLCPLAQPTFWQYNASMSLFPLPDLVVIGDPSKSFQSTQNGCMILNTGSFPNSNYSFRMYVPSSRTIEDSHIP